MEVALFFFIINIGDFSSDFLYIAILKHQIISLLCELNADVSSGEFKMFASIFLGLINDPSVYYKSVLPLGTGQMLIF